MLVSACLLGVACRYDGASKACPALAKLMDRVTLIPVCPEQLGGLPTPRVPSERRGDRVMAADGTDVTQAFLRGAVETSRLAKSLGARLALLKARSPSCGLGEIYDGSFTGRCVPGAGVTAEALVDIGIEVFNETEIDALIRRAEGA